MLSRSIVILCKIILAIFILIFLISSYLLGMMFVNGDYMISICFAIFMVISYFMNEKMLEKLDLMSGDDE